MKNIFITLIFSLILMPLFGKSDANTFEFKKGMNISHWLSQSSKRGEGRLLYFTRDDVKYLAMLGFDHLRIPIDEEQMFSESGTKNAEAFELLHNAIKWCKEFNMNVLVDLHILRSHHFNAKEKPLFTEAKAQEQFYDCWRQLSSELKKYPNKMVAYELMNEPVADDDEQWNVIVGRCIEVVRKLEPKRTIFIGPNKWQGYERAKTLRLPENDPYLVMSFHYYNPFPFTHYMASWSAGVKDYKGPIHYPGKLITDSELEQLSEADRVRYGHYNKQESNIDVIASHFKQVTDVAQRMGLRVYCGEFGVIHAAPDADKNRWYKDMSTLFNRMDIGWAAWDYKGGFGIIKDGVEQSAKIKAMMSNDK